MGPEQTQTRTKKSKNQNQKPVALLIAAGIAPQLFKKRGMTMTDYNRSNPAPAFMAGPLQDICSNLLVDGEMSMNGAIKKLRRLHFYYSRRFVSYSSYTLDHGSSYLQIHPQTLPTREVLEGIYFSKKHNDIDEGREELVFAVASLTVLLTASEKVLDDLNNYDDIMAFWQAHLDGMGLVKCVINALNSVLVVEEPDMAVGGYYNFPAFIMQRI